MFTELVQTSWASVQSGTRMAWSNLDEELRELFTEIHQDRIYEHEIAIESRVKRQLDLKKTAQKIRKQFFTVKQKREMKRKQRESDRAVIRELRMANVPWKSNVPKPLKRVSDGVE